MLLATLVRVAVVRGKLLPFSTNWISPPSTVTLKPMLEAILRNLLFLYLTSRWDNAERIRSLNVPVLFVSGLSDELIPPGTFIQPCNAHTYATIANVHTAPTHITVMHAAHMRQLHDTASPSALREFYGVPAGKHNDTWVCGGEEYGRVMDAFISKLAGPRSADL